jgi:hypothetical protein
MRQIGLAAFAIAATTLATTLPKQRPELCVVPRQRSQGRLDQLRVRQPRA